MSINLQEPSISLSQPGDEEIIGEVVNYLNQNYAEPLNQGPIRLTGSAVYGKDPNDYDLVVQRQAEDERDFSSDRYQDRRINRQNAVESESDDRIIAAMMRDLSDDIAFDTYNGSNTIERTQALLDKSRQVMPWNIGQPHNPESRYELRIGDTDFDITFTPSDPNKDYITLTEDHGQV